MTKKELINLLQMVYTNTPPCSCYVGTTERGQIDPNCHRHAVFTEHQLNYIRVALTNSAVKDAAQEIQIV